MATTKKIMPELPGKGRCVIEFLAERETIKDLIEKGWPAKSIWSRMLESGTFSGGYRNFVKLLNGHILGAKNDPKATPLEPAETPATAQTKQIGNGLTHAIQPMTQTNKNLETGAKEPKKITTFEAVNVGNLGAKNANAIQDDLV